METEQPEERKTEIQNENAKEPTEEKIDYDTFSKVKLQTATILEAERVPNSEKLLKMTIDLGHEKRQLVAGIAGSYSPEEAIGKQIIVVANLKPRKIRGVESNGMLLAVEGEDKRIILLTTEKRAENGLRVQ